MTYITSSLYRMVYCSRQTPEVVADLDLVVEQIIETAIRHNRTAGLTGLLLAVQGHFIQALEGSIDDVRTTFARISMDPRHEDLHIISRGPAVGRLFGEWNMCASALAPTDKAIVSVLDGKADFNPQALTPVSTQRLLTTVADIQRRAALTVFVG